MPTTFVKGDFLAETPLTDGPRAFAFAADVSGAMDVGTAVAVKKRWPAIAEFWAARCAGNKTQAGDAVAWRDGADVVYVLAIERRGAKPKLSWLDRAVRAMVADAARSGATRISVPRLWGGPNGLDGARVKRVLAEVGDAAPVVLVVFEQFIRGVAAPAAASAAPPASKEPKTKARPAAKARPTAKRVRRKGR